MLRAGTLIGGRYRLDALLGAGGMGEVWRGVDTVLGRTVAVKVMRPSVDPTFSARFQSEARTMAVLQHRGIVQVYDYGQSLTAAGATAPYLVMECVDGEPLSRVLAARGRLDAAQTLSIVAEVADALQAAHELGIVHRDVKPSNLLITGGSRVKLADFGVARSPVSSSAAASGVTASGALIGTADYMAPEQALGRLVSPSADVYALGAVAYHCLSGHAPFSGGSPLEIALHQVQDEPSPLPPDVPAPVRELVARAMAKDAAGRFQTAAALAVAARAAAGGAVPTRFGGAGVTRAAGPVRSGAEPVVAAGAAVVPAYGATAAGARPPSLRGVNARPGPVGTAVLAATAAVLITAGGGLLLGLTGKDPVLREPPTVPGPVVGSTVPVLRPQEPVRSPAVSGVPSARPKTLPAEPSATPLTAKASNASPKPSPAVTPTESPSPSSGR